MAKSKTLINRTTKKEFKTSDPDSVMKRFPRTFIQKPDAELDDEIKTAEQNIVSRTIADLEDYVTTTTDIGELESLLKSEASGKNRDGAKHALEGRIEQLKAEADEATE